MCFMDVEPQPAPRTLPWESLLATQIRASRLERAWTQAILADKVGKLGLPLRQQQIDRIEHGQRPISLDEAMVFAEAFDAELPDLIAARREPSANERRRATLIEAAEFVAGVLARLDDDCAQMRSRRDVIAYVSDAITDSKPSLGESKADLADAALELRLVYARVESLLSTALERSRDFANERREESTLLRDWWALAESRDG